MLKSVPLVSKFASLPKTTRFSSTSNWQFVEQVPLDAIKIVTANFQKDASSSKVNLGEGVYKDNEGKPVVLSSVREAERRIFEAKLDHEYAPIGGVPVFNNLVTKFAFGADSKVVKENRVATVQSLSGTGALRLGTEFLRRYTQGATKIYVPNPTWVNHIPISRHAGFDVETYRYYNKATNSLDFEGALEDIRNAPRHSIVMFHACAHNPTGIDPTKDQWHRFSDVCKERDHVVFFDNAYQGFASGDPEADAYSFRYFVDQGHQVVVTQSFAKNFGLYGERVGAFYVVCKDEKEAAAVSSQLNVIIRAMYSNPPLFGARIVSTVLDDEALHKQWRSEVLAMSGRIKSMREALVTNLRDMGSKRDWSHITNQIGMFAFTGLSPVEVEKFIKEHHVYLTKDGRISISGINTKNVQYLAQAFHAVTK